MGFTLAAATAALAVRLPRAVTATAAGRRHAHDGASTVSA
jgi:hypothetical protein